MPAYQYEALDAQGNTAKGVIEADTAKAARGLLRSQALVPLAVETVASGASTAANQGSFGARCPYSPDRKRVV